MRRRESGARNSYALKEAQATRCTSRKIRIAEISPSVTVPIKILRNCDVPFRYLHPDRAVAGPHAIRSRAGEGRDRLRCPWRPRRHRRGPRSRSAMLAATSAARWPTSNGNARAWACPSPRGAHLRRLGDGLVPAPLARLCLTRSLARPRLCFLGLGATMDAWQRRCRLGWP